MSQTSFGAAPLGQAQAMFWPPAEAGAAPRRRNGRRMVPTVIAAGLFAALSLAVSSARHPADGTLAGAPAVEQASAPIPVPTLNPALPPLPAPSWRDIPNPEHIYALDLPGFPDLPRDYSARQHEAGGGREDRLALGAMNGTTPAVRLRIFRGAGEALDGMPSDAPIYAALAHEAAEAGLSVARSGLPEILPTRFGRFEIADLALRRAEAGAPLACSGFRLIRDEPALSITGLACGAQAAPLDRAEVGCLIERLDVAAVGNDRALADFFAQAEHARNPGCPIAEAPVAGSPIAELLQDVAPTGKPATGRRRLRRR